MKRELERLEKFTEDCRYDMHEPYEQGLVSRVVGNKLDNAMGNRIGLKAMEQGWQEFVVILEKDGEIETFNLATLIALARQAKLFNQD